MFRRVLRSVSRRIWNPAGLWESADEAMSGGREVRSRSEGSPDGPSRASVVRDVRCRSFGSVVELGPRDRDSRPGVNHPIRGSDRGAPGELPEARGHQPPGRANLPSRAGVAAAITWTCLVGVSGFFDDQVVHSSELQETALRLDSVAGRLEDEIYKASAASDARKAVRGIRAPRRMTWRPGFCGNCRRVREPRPMWRPPLKGIRPHGRGKR